MAISQLKKPKNVQREENPIDQTDTVIDASQTVILTIATAWAILGMCFIINKPQFMMFLILIFMLPALAVIIKVIHDIAFTKRLFKINQDIIEKKYLEDLKNEEKRFEQEKKFSINYKVAKEKLCDALSKISDLLERLYSIGIIDKKYQYNLVAISTFAEYFNSGRCSVFEGYEGAYNIYENKIRMGVIVSDIDIAIQELEKLRINQYHLYSLLKAINSQRNNVMTDLKKISETNSCNSEYMNYIYQISDRNKTIENTYKINIPSS